MIVRTARRLVGRKFAVSLSAYQHDLLDLWASLLIATSAQSYLHIFAFSIRLLGHQSCCGNTCSKRAWHAASSCASRKMFHLCRISYRVQTFRWQHFPTALKNKLLSCESRAMSHLTGVPVTIGCSTPFGPCGMASSRT